MQYENSAINYIKKTSQTQDLFYTRSFLIANFLVQNNNHFIYESHVFEKDFHNPYFINFINLISKQHNGKIVAISDYIYLNYIKNGLLKNKIKVFPDGVDKKFFNLGTATRKQVIAQLFKDTNIYNKKIVLYTGSLRKEKGIFFLLKAAEQIPELNFVVIGGKAKEVTYIKRQIQTNNFFIHHAVEYKYIPLLLLESDILIMPYLKKGELIKSMSPLKLFEYLASGKPLLASNLPAFENILKDEVNAFLFMPESIESLRRTIHKVLSLSSQQLNLIKEHQIATASKYTWDNRVKEILTWYYKG
jgi:glycosyltransferase involved in cell wall biosynthesis